MRDTQNQTSRCFLSAATSRPKTNKLMATKGLVNEITDSIRYQRVQPRAYIEQKIQVSELLVLLQISSNCPPEEILY